MNKYRSFAGENFTNNMCLGERKEASFTIYLINKVLIVNRDYLLTYLLTPWSRVLLEKLTGLQLVKKFPAFYGT
jgi:hypothetical protein